MKLKHKTETSNFSLIMSANWDIVSISENNPQFYGQYSAVVRIFLVANCSVLLVLLLMIIRDMTEPTK